MADDHYVPRFYLRKFQAKPGRIWCYEAGRFPSLMGIKKVAAKPDYYTLKQEVHGIDSNLVDDLFQTLENQSAPIIRNLIRMKKLEMSNDDYCMLAAFIATLFNRTPSFEQNQIRSIESLLNHVNSFVTSDKERFRAAARSAGIDVENETPEELEEIRQLLMKGVKLDRERSKRMLLGTAIKPVFDGVAEVVYHKEWHLLHSDSSRVFITSDNPVTLLPPTGHHPSDGLGFLDASIFLPLSPKRALWLRNDRLRENLIEINQKMVDLFNEVIMKWADKQIYSNLKCAEFDETFAAIQKEKEAQREGKKESK
jgi:hypothetical protein